MFAWKLLAKLVYLIANRIIVTCDASYSELPELSVTRPKVRKVYNGITIPPLNAMDAVARRNVLGNNITGERQIVGMVARLAPNKGQTNFLHAVPKVLAELPNTQFVIVGDVTSETSWEIEYRESLHRLAEQLGLKDIVHFLGKRLDIYPVLQAFDIFVHPASSDILPTVVFQAMAVGKPVVATSVGGLPEIVGHNVTGIIVPPERPKLLAEAIIRLLRNRDESHKMGVAARTFACSKFSCEKYVENTERIYRELLD
jgi:glycosyltransferase involved in cell wall biosynthesis